MILESTDNAYRVNQKLSNLLNNEDEEQYITKKFEIESVPIDNQHSVSYDNLFIDYKNNNLCTGNTLNNLSYKTFCSLKHDTRYASETYSFSPDLGGLVVTFLFSKTKGSIKKDDIIKQYPYIFLPQDIENYYLELDWSKTESKTIKVQLYSGDIENKNILFELSLPRIQDDEAKTKILDMIILFNKDADYLIKEVE